jgi:hypothetical protein
MLRPDDSAVEQRTPPCPSSFNTRIAATSTQRIERDLSDLNEGTLLGESARWPPSWLGLDLFSADETLMTGTSAIPRMVPKLAI